MFGMISDAIDLPKLVGIGVGIVEGVWQGIKNMTAWFAQKIKDFFAGMVTAAMNALRAHSPSMVFADIGRNMGLGLGLGLFAQLDQVERDMAASMSGLGQMASAGVRAGAGMSGESPAQVSARAGESLGAGGSVLSAAASPAAGPELHLHIGTLVADERGLELLERKLRGIRVTEDQRIGLATG
jgi:hypothetical protein